MFVKIMVQMMKKIHKCSSHEMRNWLSKGHFQEGTMKPKIEAALYFLDHHGEKAIITSIDNIENAIKREMGTIVKGLAMKIHEYQAKQILKNLISPYKILYHQGFF